ncbi:MAG: hypothetical protein H6861_07225 [Rhodospirillales bacterium]|nr:hypothetical protein [Rhodospirillales bacterium]
MAENAEITANADSVKTLDFGRITSATTTFAIPPTGLISREIWALIGNLNLQGLTGVSSGIATGHEEKETEEERDNRKAREKLSLALLQIELDRMIEALRTKIEDTEKLIIILEEEIKDLLQVKEEIASTLKEFKSKLEENRQARTDIDKLYDRYNTGLHKMLPAAAHDNLDFLLQRTGIHHRTRRTSRHRRPASLHRLQRR